MNEDALHSLRGLPSDEFSAALRGRLHAMETATRDRARARRRGMWLKPLAAAAALAALMAIPAVRASAESLLQLFRVRTFIAVPLSNARVRDLNRRLDVGQLLGGTVNVIEPAGSPIDVASPEEAAEAAGFAVRLPRVLPDGAALAKTSVLHASHAQLTVEASRLAQIMTTLGIDDLAIPPALDGQIVDIRTSPVVFTTYSLDGLNTQVELVQGLIPTVQLPADLNMSALGEIGLRILGLESDEAHRLAQAIDWKTTLLVPIPPDAQSFRQVDVNGVSGLLVEKSGPAPQSVLLWATSDRAYAMTGSLGGDQLVTLAASVR